MQQKGPVKPLLSPQQEEEVKAIHAEDDDSYNSGFGAYLRSAEGECEMYRKQRDSQRDSVPFIIYIMQVLREVFQRSTWYWVFSQVPRPTPGPCRSVTTNFLANSSVASITF